MKKLIKLRYILRNKSQSNKQNKVLINFKKNQKKIISDFLKDFSKIDKKKFFCGRLDMSY